MLQMVLPVQERKAANGFGAASSCPVFFISGAALYAHSADFLSIALPAGNVRCEYISLRKRVKVNSEIDFSSLTFYGSIFLWSD